MNPSTVKTCLPWVVAVALFMEGLDTTIVNTAIPAIAEGLQVTPLSLKAVVTSYILSLAVCIPVSGWMADRYGTRRVFSIAARCSPWPRSCAGWRRTRRCWYLGELPQTDRAAVMTALHYTLLTLGAFTMLSSLSFWALRARDGESVSRGSVRVAEE